MLTFKGACTKKAVRIGRGSAIHNAVGIHNALGYTMQFERFTEAWLIILCDL